MRLDLDDLAAQLEVFAVDRGWGRFHSPKNLAMALIAEAGELVEQLQWLTEDESFEHAGTAAVADEVADILIYLVRFAAVSGIDLEAAVNGKMHRNAERFPKQADA
jgi:NTP pyrophosphatase (non-canonical NTP hydrolase)